MLFELLYEVFHNLWPTLHPLLRCHQIKYDAVDVMCHQIIGMCNINNLKRSCVFWVIAPCRPLKTGISPLSSGSKTKPSKRQRESKWHVRQACASTDNQEQCFVAVSPKCEDRLRLVGRPLGKVTEPKGMYGSGRRGDSGSPL
jgi:hypothetical protein